MNKLRKQIHEQAVRDIEVQRKFLPENHPKPLIIWYLYKTTYSRYWFCLCLLFSLLHYLRPLQARTTAKKEQKRSDVNVLSVKYIAFP